RRACILLARLVIFSSSMNRQQRKPQFGGSRAELLHDAVETATARKKNAGPRRSRHVSYPRPRLPLIALLVGDPPGVGGVIGHAGGVVELVLIGVHREVPFVVLLGAFHVAERNRDVLGAGADEAADLDDERRDLPVGADQNVLDLADLLVRRVIDVLLV